jgi:hypothetical protein
VGEAKARCGDEFGLPWNAPIAQPANFLRIEVQDIHRSHAFYGNLGFQTLLVYGEDDFIAGVDCLLKAPSHRRGIVLELAEETRIELVQQLPGLGADQEVESVGPVSFTVLVPASHPVWACLRRRSKEQLEQSANNFTIHDPDGLKLIFTAAADADNSSPRRLASVPQAWPRVAGPHDLPIGDLGNCL